MKVYEKCKVYGPYQGPDKRLRVSIIFPSGKKKTLSYPKYLVECHLDCYLLGDLTIDHIDGNFLNNTLSNLRIIERVAHCGDDAIRNKDLTLECKWCGRLFTIEGKTLKQRNRRKSSGFCSRSCTGKYGKYIQQGGDPYGLASIIIEKYKMKDFLDLKSNISEF
jgi:hypothetical protein